MELPSVSNFVDFYTVHKKTPIQGVPIGNNSCCALGALALMHKYDAVKLNTKTNYLINFLEGKGYNPEQLHGLWQGFDYFNLGQPRFRSENYYIGYTLGQQVYGAVKNKLEELANERLGLETENEVCK